MIITTMIMTMNKWWSLTVNYIAMIIQIVLLRPFFYLPKKKFPLVGTKPTASIAPTAIINNTSLAIFLEKKRKIMREKITYPSPSQAITPSWVFTAPLTSPAETIEWNVKHCKRRIPQKFTISLVRLEKENHKNTFKAPTHLAERRKQDSTSVIVEHLTVACFPTTF